jgi:fucose permease
LPPLAGLDSQHRYAASFAGWFISALTNTHLTTTLRLSLGATLLLGASLQLLSQLLRFWNPPFGLFASTFFLTSLGQAYQDSYSNTFVANVPGAHRWLGFIHAMYMLGCLVGPFIATPIAGHSKWYYTYAVEAGLGAVNIAFVCFAFKDDLLGRKNRVGTKASHDNEVRTVATTSNAEDETPSQSRNKQAFQEIQQTLKLKAVWLMSLYFFFFLGAVITAGGRLFPPFPHQPFTH